MRIVIFDTWLPQAHRKLYNSIIELLSKDNSLIVINKNNYYDCVSNNIVYKNIPLLDLDHGGLWYKRLAHFFNFFLARISIIGERYDLSLVTTYHTRHFEWQYRWMCKKPVLIIEHYNVDDIASSSMLCHYLNYANKVHHLVFAPFIGDYINTLGVNNDNIHFIHHPLFTVNNPVARKEKNAFTSVLSPGLSNDESIIESIIEYEKKNGILAKNSIKLTLRTNKDYNNVPAPIKFMKGFLTKDEYESLYNTSDYVLVIYPPSYRFRFSSVILNSMTKHKVLIGNNIDIVHYFSEKYPTNCLMFDSVKTFFDLIIEKPQFSEEERNIFIEEHSNESIEREINNILTNILS